jgi:hypothetical protein
MLDASSKLDRILTQSIQRIEEKGWTVEDCLEQYPAYKTELEPMLRAALRLRQARRFSPSSAFRSSAQTRIRKRLQSSRRSPSFSKSTQASAHQSRPVKVHPRMRFAGGLVPLLLIFLMIIGTGGGIAFAADHAKPGDVLFGVDRALEDVQIYLENDIQQIVRLHLRFADERIKEAVELVQQGDIKDLSSALQDYREQIMATAPLILKMQSEGENINNLISETNDKIDTQKETLRDLIGTTPIEVETASLDTIDEAEKIRRVVVAPAPTQEPVADKTSESFAYEPELPTIPPPTYLPPTAVPATSVPPSVTDTPGAFILPTNTIPIPGTPSPFPTSSITPTPGTITPTFTPTHTRTPTPTPSRTPTPSATPFSPTNTYDKRPPTATFIAE